MSSSPKAHTMDGDVDRHEDSKSDDFNTNKDEQNKDDNLQPPENVESEQKLSKRKIRKLKKKENALKYRQEKRLRERENKKRRKRELKDRGEELGPSKKVLKKNTMANSSCEVKVVIDCSFDELMGERDIMKLTQQLSHAYSANRRAENPLQMYVTSLGGKAKERMDRIGDYVSWDVYFKEEDYVKVFDKESLVYLSSESDNILQSIEPDKVYVIGGLVDHNSQKGLCHKLAVEKGINHAQLPIGQYIDIKTRKVLTVNHVFEIILRYTESRDWKEAFFRVIPQRKGVSCKESTTTMNTNSDSNITDSVTNVEEKTEESSTSKNNTKGEEIAIETVTTNRNSEHTDSEVKNATQCSERTSECGFS